MKTELVLLHFRVRTALKSFKVIYSLPEDKVQAFIDAYEIYTFDWKKETELLEKLGPDYYQHIKGKIIDWYCVINHLCALGEIEKMYIPPVIDPEASISQNQQLFEAQMSKDLRIIPGHQVLDMGCGRGCIAMHIASITGGNVLGINIDQDQLKSAKKVAERRGLADQCHFQITDFNLLPFSFASNSFDAVYQVQAFSLSKDLQSLFCEIYRILKHGGRFGALDWVGLPAYDPDNEYHQFLLSRVKPLIGAIGTPSAEEYVRLLENAGFKIIIHCNLSVDGYQQPLIDRADAYFTKLWKATKFLVKCNLLPQHIEKLLRRLTQDGKLFSEADRLGLFTTSYYIVAEKPLPGHKN